MPMPHSTITVAIADDHVLYLEALSNLISNIPSCRVIIKAGNGKDLLDQLSVNLTPDIILLDVSMPEMDGCATMAILKKKTPGIKVLALSGYGDGLTALQMYRLGVKGFLSKRADPGEIIEALNTVLQGGSYFSGYEEFLQQKDVAPAVVESLHELSYREIVFLKYACTDLSYKEIAERMNVSRYTIDDYRDALFSKFDVQTRASLIITALKYKLVDPSSFVQEKNEKLIK